MGRGADRKLWSQLNNDNLICRHIIYDNSDDDGEDDEALPPVVHSELYPAGSLFHVVVFITKSNIPLCSHRHPSPWLTDFLCTCVFPHVCVCDESQSPCDGVMTSPQSDTKAHVQKSSCFIVCSGTGLCFLLGGSKQQSLKSRVTEGTWVKESEYINAWS